METGRRGFIKICSLSALVVGGLVWIFSQISEFVTKLSVPFSETHETLDMIAFVETLYPLISPEKMRTHFKVISSKREEWEIINRLFFTQYYIDSKEKFHTLSLDRREEILINFEKEYNMQHPALLEQYRTARVILVKNIVSHGYSPLSAYGYPDKHAFPFMADPSWTEYHVKPTYKL